MDLSRTLCFRNGPVPNVCVWFRARSSRFPEFGTHGCHCGNDRLPIARNWGFKHIRSHGFRAGNQRLPLQATSNSQRLELMPPNVGTKLPQPGIASSKTLKLTVPNLGTRGYHCTCLFQQVGKTGSQPRIHVGYTCKQLPVTRGWNSCFQNWEP